MRVLFVSKPITPPWNDSSKNLAKDLAGALPRTKATVMVRRGDAAPARAEAMATYPARAASATFERAAVMATLLARGGAFPIWHFFFAPNARSAAAGRLASRLKRVRTVQTVCSAPAEGADLEQVLFTDRVVVLSEHTERRLRDAGVSAARLVRIPPAIAPLAPLVDISASRRELGLDPDRVVVVYAGDLEFGGGAESMLAACVGRPYELVMACRAKTFASREAERRLRVRYPGARWFGETPHIHTLLGCADVVALPSADLFAKMDYPLVLLEAMSMERPVLVGRGTAAEELCVGGGALAVDNTADAIRAGIVAALDDETLGARGRRQVLARFTPDVMATAYEALYGELR